MRAGMSSTSTPLVARRSAKPPRGPGDLAKARLIRYPHGPFRERAWSLRNELTAYDAMYLALAEAFQDPVLLTGDAGLAAVARGSLGPERVRHVAD
jgi:hypothetical protein